MRHLLARLSIVVLASAACAVMLVLATGLAVTDFAGASDNGDGSRLYCGAALVPTTPQQKSDWMGGVIEFYEVDSTSLQTCQDPIPSAALTMLKAAVGEAPDGTIFDIRALGWFYVAAFAAVTAIAAWATTAAALWRVLYLVPMMAPLANTDFARFLLSTYGEPAGLLGTYAMLGGTAGILATTPRHRITRAVALALVAGGGLFTVWAKVAYAPVLIAAFVVCAVTAVGLTKSADGWPSRIVGPVFAGLLIILGVPIVQSGVQWQDRNYADGNVHNLIYTAVLVEIPGAAGLLGLPREAAQYAGTPIQTSALDKPGRAEIAADPQEFRSRAIRMLLVSPEVLSHGLGLGLQATQGRDLVYLESDPWEPGAQFVNKPSTEEDMALSAGQQSATATSLGFWLGRMPLPWLPAVLVGIGLAVGLLGLLFRQLLASSFAILAGVAAATSLALVAAALADGYFELAKHVWLASYLVDVVALALAGAVLMLPPEAVRWTRGHRHHGESAPRHAAGAPSAPPAPEAPPAAVPVEVGHGPAVTVPASGP